MQLQSSLWFRNVSSMECKYSPFTTYQLVTADLLVIKKALTMITLTYSLRNGSNCVEIGVNSN